MRGKVIRLLYPTILALPRTAVLKLPPVFFIPRFS